MSKGLRCQWVRRKRVASRRGGNCRMEDKLARVISRCGQTTACTPRLLHKKNSIIGITVMGPFFFCIFFNALKFLDACGVAELSEKKKRLHFCLRFTLK
jgi:hypothetical protein